MLHFLLNRISTFLLIEVQPSIFLKSIGKNCILMTFCGLKLV